MNAIFLLFVLCVIAQPIPEHEVNHRMCTDHGGYDCGSMSCVCNDNFCGQFCEVYYPESNTSVCSGHGAYSCEWNNCTCAQYYCGTDCSLDILYMSQEYCSGHGLWDCNSETCTCDPGYCGAGCSEDVQILSRQYCSSHGQWGCDTGLCSCDLGYCGSDCSQDKNYGLYYCSGDAYTYDSIFVGSFKNDCSCDCMNGYLPNNGTTYGYGPCGRMCDLTSRVWGIGGDGTDHWIPCDGHGTVVYSNCSCVCDQGWGENENSTRSCDKFCPELKCANGGQPADSSCTSCACQPGWCGIYCDKQDGEVCTHIPNGMFIITDKKLTYFFSDLELYHGRM